MKPKVIKFARQQQGNLCPESRWAIGHTYIMRHVLLRQQEITVDDDEYFLDYKDEDGNLTVYFDVEQLRMIDMCRLAYFDESHCKCIDYGCSNRDPYGVYIIFPRDENNRPDVNGTFTDNDGNKESY